MLPREIGGGNVSLPVSRILQVEFTGFYEDCFSALKKAPILSMKNESLEAACTILFFKEAETVL
jgi:hypothetical protein